MFSQVPSIFRCEVLIYFHVHNGVILRLFFIITQFSLFRERQFEGRALSTYYNCKKPDRRPRLNLLPNSVPEKGYPDLGERLVSDWLNTGHVTQLTHSDWPDRDSG